MGEVVGVDGERERGGCEGERQVRIHHQSMEKKGGEDRQKVTM